MFFKVAGRTKNKSSFIYFYIYKLIPATILICTSFIIYLFLLQIYNFLFKYKNN